MSKLIRFVLYFILHFVSVKGISQIINFKSVKIGNQIWMSENLSITKFRNGDSITQAKTKEEWNFAGETMQPAWCYYDNDSSNGLKYGKLYNWHAVNDPRGLAPVGWHIPSDGEWTLLINFLGDENTAGSKMKKTENFSSNNNVNNEEGFNGLLGGGRRNAANFVGLKSYGYWWSSTEHLSNYAWCRYLFLTNKSVRRSYYFKHKGCSVRCVKD